MKPLKAILFLLLVIGFASALSSAQTVILVRHAEKISDVPDATLSDMGKQRAEKLASMLKDAGITAIFTTEVERTKQTAAPLAKQSQLRPTVIPAKNIDALVAKLRALPDYAVALVIGHSNTVPKIVEQLLSVSAGGNLRRLSPSIEMKSSEYDRLYIVQLRGITVQGVNLYGADPPKLILLHY